MKKRQLFYALPLLAGALFISDLAISKLTNFTTVNRANDVAGPGVTTRKNCTSCHADFAAINDDTISRVFTMDAGIKEYTPGTTHTIKFKMYSTATVGFSATVLKNDSNKMVGTLAPIDAAETKVFLHAASGRSYINHQVGATTAGMKEYSFSWTAPAKGTGPVTFYFSSLSSNLDNDLTGDTVFNNAYVITEKIASGLNKEAFAANMKVYPNPASGNINVSFNNTSSGIANISLCSLDGKQTFELGNESMHAGNQNLSFELPSNLTSGIYFVKISINQSNLVQKVLIY